MRKNLSRKLVTAAASAVLIVLGAASLAAANNGGRGGWHDDAIPVFDHWFVKDALRSGAFEIAAGDDASAHGGTAVARFGATLAHDHRADTAELQGIAAALGWESPDAPTPVQQWVLDTVRSSAGAAYDGAWIAAQVAAHEQAIELYEKEATWGHQWEVQAYAQRALPVLQQHLDMLRALAGGASPSSTTPVPTLPTVPPTTTVPAPLSTSLATTTTTSTTTTGATR